MAFEPNEKFSELLTQLKAVRRSIPRSQTAEHQAFVDAFPATELATLTLEKYCVGRQSRESFCWWIERGLQPVLGRYMPGTSRGHIVYFKPDGEVYKNRKLRDLPDEAALQYTLKIQAAIANADITEDLGWIDDDDQLFKRAGVEPRVSIGDGRKLRILCCYNPDDILPISSSNHLKHFLELFGCPIADIPKVEQPIARSMLLRDLFFAAKKQITVHAGNKMFRLEPDLLLESANQKWVLDTKWKKLDAGDRGNKYGLSQGDFYQLYAYGKKYLAGQTPSELVLIYPATNLFAQSLPVFDYGDGMKLWVLPFDLADQVLIDLQKTTLPLGHDEFSKKQRN